MTERDPIVFGVVFMGYTRRTIEYGNRQLRQNTLVTIQRAMKAYGCPYHYQNVMWVGLPSELSNVEKLYDEGASTRERELGGDKITTEIDTFQTRTDWTVLKNEVPRHSARYFTISNLTSPYHRLPIERKAEA